MTHQGQLCIVHFDVGLGHVLVVKGGADSFPSPRRETCFFWAGGGVHMQSYAYKNDQRLPSCYLAKSWYFENKKSQLRLIGPLFLKDNGNQSHPRHPSPMGTKVMLGTNDAWHRNGEPEKVAEAQRINEEKKGTGWWFRRFFIFTPTWGRFLCWLIFFKGVETTN